MTNRTRGLPATAALLTVACGRSPVLEEPSLFVQVVDEAGDGVRLAEVELREVDDASERVHDRARADENGVAEFEYPGAGRYELRATTDLVCCLHEGMLDVVVTGWDEMLIVETVTGSCPLWVPPSCR